MAVRNGDKELQPNAAGVGDQKSEDLIYTAAEVLTFAEYETLITKKL